MASTVASHICAV